jgi:hypothetical protein
MKETIDFTELFLTILPFIVGIIAIGLIPAKKKIIARQITEFKVEILIVVYLLAMFILGLGFYYFVPLFSEDSTNQMVNIVNGIMMAVIGLGIMAVNYHNYSIYSDIKSGGGLESSVEGLTSGPAEAIEATPVEYIEESTPKQKIQITRPEPELLECPRCSKTITITVSKRPLKIQCPHCGVEGMIR